MIPSPPAFPRAGLLLSALLLCAPLPAQRPVDLPAGPGRRDEAPSARDQARAAARTQLLQAAEADRAFRAADPRHPEAKEARRREAKSRLLAALLGPDAPAPELLALAKEVRHDARLAAQDRFEVAALEEMAAAHGRRFQDRGEWLRHREERARKLIAEFGEVPAAYGHLLQVAEVNPGPRGVALAQQLVDSPAPAAMKAAAQDIVQRQSLPGRTLGDVIGGLPGAAALLEEAFNRPVVFYTWSPEDESGMARLKSLAAALPAEALVLGVNLGRDVPAALAAAARENLPGAQLYGARAHDSPVVRRLALTKPGLLYVARRDGVLLNLSQARDPSVALAGLE